MASELESDLRDTADWDRKWLIDFNSGKTQLASFYQSSDSGATDVKMDRSVLLLFVSINLPYSLAQSTVVMSGLVLLVVT